MTYVERVLARFEDVTVTSSGWTCTCPSATHGDDDQDSSPSLRISIGAGGKILITCRVGCPLQSVLLAANLKGSDLFCPPGETPLEPLASTPSELSDSQADLRHKVYTALLHRLGLSSEHKKALLVRGLSPKAITEGNYRSLIRTDCGKLAHSIYDEFGESLYLVPGFTEGPYGPALMPTQGLVIPCMDLQGRFIAIKVRQDNEQPTKYLYVSHAGNTCGNHTHCPPGRPDTLEVVRVTEGELKAAVACQLSDLYTLSIPGINSWHVSLPVLKALSVRRVLVSFDWKDVCTKPQVKGVLLSYLDALKDAGYLTGVETWEGDYKGVDDALAARQPLTQRWGTEVQTLFVNRAASPPAPPSTPYEAWVPKPFPLEVFPPNLRTFVVEASATLQTPPDWISLGILVAAGRALGTSRVITLDPQWREWGNLYGVVVAAPGKLKTAAMKWAMQPVLTKQKELSRLRDTVRRKEIEWRRQVKIARLMKKDPPNPDPDVLAIPSLEHVYVENYTVEAAIMRMNENAMTGRRDSSLLTFHDELSAWVRQMNAYRSGQGADRNFALSCWSVNQVKVDRKTDGETITIEMPCMSVYGGIQPDLLSEFEDKQGRDDGFLDRLLFTCPRFDKVWSPEEDPKSPEAAVIQVWADAFNFLWEYIRPPANGPLAIATESDATRKIWVAWGKKHAAECDAPGFPKSLGGPWSKLRGYYARFALILHYLWLACEGEEALLAQGRLIKSAASTSLVEGKITADDLHRAELLVEYFKDHHKGARLEALCDPEERLIQEMVTWVRTQGGSVSARQVQRERRFRAKTASEADALLRKAADLGYGHLTAKGTGDARKGARFTLGEDTG